MVEFVIFLLGIGFIIGTYVSMYLIFMNKNKSNKKVITAYMNKIKLNENNDISIDDVVSSLSKENISVDFTL